MSKVPDKCPMCGEKTLWKKVDESNKGFSVGSCCGSGIIGSRRTSWRSFRKEETVLLLRKMWF